VGSVAYNLSEGKDYNWYVKGIFLANWVVIYHRLPPIKGTFETAIEIYVLLKYTSYGQTPSWSNRQALDPKWALPSDTVMCFFCWRQVEGIPYRWGDILREGRPVYLYTFADYILHPIYMI